MVGHPLQEGKGVMIGVYTDNTRAEVDTESSDSQN